LLGYNIGELFKGDTDFGLETKKALGVANARGTDKGSAQRTLAWFGCRRCRRGTRYLRGRRHLRLSPVGGRILGRNNLQALRSHHPGKPSGFKVRRMIGSGDLWVTEYTIDYQGRSAYTVSIMEFRNGKVVHETQYFADPFEAPAWRSQCVQQAD